MAITFFSLSKSDPLLGTVDADVKISSTGNPVLSDTYLDMFGLTARTSVLRVPASRGSLASSFPPVLLLDRVIRVMESGLDGFNLMKFVSLCYDLRG